jgi:glycine dehydrogenase
MGARVNAAVSHSTSSNALARSSAGLLCSSASPVQARCIASSSTSFNIILGKTSSGKTGSLSFKSTYSTPVITTTQIRSLASATDSTSVSSIFKPLDTFPRRHIGPSDEAIAEMCKVVGVKNLDELVKLTVPESITIQNKTNLGPGMSEIEVLDRLKAIASKNKVLKSFIGMGYVGAVTPKVILRNIMENPAWYTQVSRSFQ